MPTARVVPPGWKARECGHLPARTPIISSKPTARRQHFPRGLPGHRLEALRDRLEPAPAGILGAREVGHEEEIEVGEMVGDVLRGVGDVGRQGAVVRGFAAGELAQRRRGGDRLRNRADAADARRDHQRVERRPPVEQLLVAAIERRRHFGAPDAPVVDVERDLQIAFDTIERADDRPRSCLAAPLARPRLLNHAIGPRVAG